MEFWMKDPRDMTEDEKWRLPTGPIIKCEREWTLAEDIAGKSRGAKKCWCEMMEIKIVPISNSDTFYDMVDKTGNRWKLRQFLNGAWFREPVYI